MADRTEIGEDHAFFINLPKVELHAHLNGSLSPSTIAKLIKYHLQNWPDEVMPEIGKTFIANSDTLHGKADAFVIFPLLHSIMDNCHAVYIATCDVIREFYEDGVKYLELRSTPKEIKGRMSKTEYCESVVSGIKQATRSGIDITVTFLLSIDRRKLGDFDSTTQLYCNLKEKYPDLIVGLDISGDQNVEPRNISCIIPKLEELKKRGIKLAVHLAEILNVPETSAFLNFGVDRIGHGTFIHPTTGGNETLLKELLANKRPVEVCLTSNIAEGKCSSYRNHHAKHLRDNNIPIIFCTDDKGLLSCTLSGEYKLAAMNFDWSRECLYEISLSSVDYIFACDEVKERLRNVWKLWRGENKKYFE